MTEEAWIPDQVRDDNGVDTLDDDRVKVRDDIGVKVRDGHGIDAKMT